MVLQRGVLGESSSVSGLPLALHPAAAPGEQSITKLLDLKSANTDNNEGLHLIRIGLCGLFHLP